MHLHYLPEQSARVTAPDAKVSKGTLDRGAVGLHCDELAVCIRPAAAIQPGLMDGSNASGSGRWPSDGELTLTDIKQPLGFAAAVIADVSCTRYCSRRNPMPS